MSFGVIAPKTPFSRVTEAVAQILLTSFDDLTP